MKVFILVALVCYVRGEADSGIQLLGFEDLFKLTQGYNPEMKQQPREEKSLLNTYPFNQGTGFGGGFSRQSSIGNLGFSFNGFPNTGTVGTAAFNTIPSGAASHATLPSGAASHATIPSGAASHATIPAGTTSLNSLPSGATLEDLGISFNNFGLVGFGTRLQQAQGAGLVQTSAHQQPLVQHVQQPLQLQQSVHVQQAQAQAAVHRPVQAPVNSYVQQTPVQHVHQAVPLQQAHVQHVEPVVHVQRVEPIAHVQHVEPVDHVQHVEPLSHVQHQLAHNEHHFQPGKPAVEINHRARQVLHSSVQEHLDHNQAAVHETAVHEDAVHHAVLQDQLRLRSRFNPARARRPALGRDPGPVLEVVAEAAERCVEKVEHVEEIQYDDVEECNHSYDKKCHTSYSTEYTNQQEVECEDNYKKECQITYSPSAHNETVRVCSRPLVKDCNLIGPVECRTEYVSECWTKEDEHTVVDDVPECQTVYEEKCHDEQKGYTTEQKCSKWPKEVCSINRQLKKKVTPQTKCEKVPQEFCGPAGCGFVQGPEECIEKVKTIVTDIPNEVCDLQPTTNCEHVTKLVPKLVPVEECVDVPKEICNTVRGPPRKVLKPISKKWCYTPTQESGLI